MKEGDQACPGVSVGLGGERVSHSGLHARKLGVGSAALLQRASSNVINRIGDRKPDTWSSARCKRVNDILIGA